MPHWLLDDYIVALNDPLVSLLKLHVSSLFDQPLSSIYISISFINDK